MRKIEEDVKTACKHCVYRQLEVVEKVALFARSETCDVHKKIFDVNEIITSKISDGTRFIPVLKENH